MAEHVPGRIITVGGRRIHLMESGVAQPGVPTVVLLSGVGGWSLLWHLVQEPVARFARVLAFDRPGYGFSDPLGPGESYDAGPAAERLHIMLESAGYAPPYVLVGHSFAGFILREYVKRYPSEVAGLLLLDVDHEAEWTDRFPPEHQKGLRLITRASGLIAALSHVGLPQLFGALGLLKNAGLDRLPTPVRKHLLAKSFTAAALCATHQEMLALQPSAEAMREVGTLGDIPTIVIRHGKPGPVAPGTKAETAARIEQLVAEVQAELAAQSARGKVICAEHSGHDVQLEAPELVIEAIRELVSLASSRP